MGRYSTVPAAACQNPRFRRTAVSYSGGESVSLAYDEDSSLTSLSYPSTSGVAYYVYDAKEVREEMGVLPGMESERPTRSAVNRVAIGRALIERGYLSIRRRRITLPFKVLFRGKIS